MANQDNQWNYTKPQDKDATMRERQKFQKGMDENDLRNQEAAEKEDGETIEHDTLQNKGIFTSGKF